jgi:7-carboxy-7-deazaguanine synthase
MTFSIKEMFYTLQGEGYHSGRPAVFCRFTGCNLWSGREQDRSNAICQFCDTDFVGIDGQKGGKFRTTRDLAERISRFWPESQAHRFVVFTGGEPGLQLTSELIDTMHEFGFECAVESNGTVALPDNLDWICISPKGVSEVIINRCNELKLVYPQPEALPERFAYIDASHRYLSPMNNWQDSMLIPGQNPNTRQCIDYCLQNPQWKLTLQSHKVLNID